MFWTILLGIATGMRTMTAIAAVCWAAYLGYLPVEGTWAAWTGKLATAIIFSVLALGEYIGDTLPRAPSRTDVGPLAARIGFAALVGVIVATVLGQPKAGGVLLGVGGALIGAYGGYRARMFGARLAGRDLPVALVESAVALGLAAWALAHIYMEIVAGANPPVLLLPR